MNKNIFIWLAIVVALGVGAYFPMSKSNVIEKIVTVGGNPGAEVTAPCFTIGGVTKCYAVQPFNTASTTRCAVRAPQEATSTLSTSGLVKAGTTTDYVMTIAKSATAYATTTVIRTETVTENGLTVFPSASTTQTALADTNRTFGPGQYAVVSTAGPTATAFDAGSACFFEFTLSK